MAYFKVYFLLQEVACQQQVHRRLKWTALGFLFCVLEKQHDCSQCTWTQCDSHGGKHECSPLLHVSVELTYYKMIHKHVPMPGDLWAARPIWNNYNCAQRTLRIGPFWWIPAAEIHLHMGPSSLGKLSNTSGLTGSCCFAMGIFLVKIVSDYKRQQTVWQSLLLKESIEQVCTASGRIWMDSYLQINCFIQITVMLFKTLHALLETPTKPSPHSTQSCHKQKSFCGTWLAARSLPLHDAALRLAEGTHQIKRVFVVVKRQTLNFSNKAFNLNLENESTNRHATPYHMYSEQCLGYSQFPAMSCWREASCYTRVTLLQQRLQNLSSGCCSWFR